MIFQIYITYRLYCKVEADIAEINDKQDPSYWDQRGEILITQVAVQIFGVAYMAKDVHTHANLIIFLYQVLFHLERSRPVLSGPNRSRCSHIALYCSLFYQMVLTFCQLLQSSFIAVVSYGVILTIEHDIMELLMDFAAMWVAVEFDNYIGEAYKIYCGHEV